MSLKEDKNTYHLVCEERFRQNENSHKEIKETMGKILENESYVRSKIDDGFGAEIRNIKENMNAFKEDTKQEIGSLRKLVWKIVIVGIVGAIAIIGDVVVQYSKMRAANNNAKYVERLVEETYESADRVTD